MRAVDHGQRDRVVEGHDRRVSNFQQRRIERQDPGPVGRLRTGPLRRGREERLLGGVLGRVDVAVAPDQRTEDLRSERAQQDLDVGADDGRGFQPSSSAWDSTMGRTSAYARSRTSAGAGICARRAAISVARSKLSHSTIQ